MHGGVQKRMRRKKVMKRKKVKKWLFGFGITFLVLGLVFLFIGFDKKNSYNNPDSEYAHLYDSDDYINSYVGGDAYNYIINGTYFTGYSVIGMGFLIMSTIACTTYFRLIFEDDISETTNEELPEF